MEQLTENVESMNKDDIDKIVGEVTTNRYVLTDYGSILDNETIYWIASKLNDGILWFFDGSREFISYDSNNTYGIRAKVTLVEGVR